MQMNLYKEIAKKETTKTKTLKRIEQTVSSSLNAIFSMWSVYERWPNGRISI